jgi:ABC-2 type transport system ATP-binding protein
VLIEPPRSQAVLRQMVFVREDESYPDFRVQQVVQAASWFYPNWSHGLAGALLEEFNLPLNRKVRAHRGRLVSRSGDA